MEKTTIKLAGKPCGAAYCYATELAFHRYTGKNVEDLDTKSPEDIIYLLLSAIAARYEADGGEPPVTDRDILARATPAEIVDATRAVFDLRARWYGLPKGEEKAGPSEGDDGQKGDQAPN